MAKSTPTDSDVRVRFGSRVRELRNERGYSHEDFADMCDLDRTYISGIERGVRNPPLLNIHRISAALNVSLSTLFDPVN